MRCTLRTTEKHWVALVAPLGKAIIAVTLLSGMAALAQTPGYQNVGRTPTDQEIRAWDIAVGPSGKELPPGSGSAREGAEVYTQKCAACHGVNLEGKPGLGPALAGGKGTLATLKPVRTVGSYWAFATTLWDFINRAMPRRQEGSLTPNEVYAVTALVLFRNQIVKQDEVLDARSLPQVQMPNRNGYYPARPDYRWYQTNCRLGKCTAKK